MGGAAGGAVFGALMGAGQSIGEGIFAAGESKKAREHQIQMYKHRYQWTMDDMREAGLNPILASQVGGGSAGPAGPAAAVRGSSAADSASRGASTALQARKLRAELKLIDKQTMAAHNLGTKHMADAMKADKETRLLMGEIPRAEAKERFDRSPEGQRLLTLERAGSLGAANAQNVKDIVNPFSNRQIRLGQ